MAAAATLVVLRLFIVFFLAAYKSTIILAQEDEVKSAIPEPAGTYAFFEGFTSRQDFDNRWVRSDAKKEGAEEEVAKFDGEWAVEEAQEKGLPGDLGLVLKSKAKHHGVSVRLEKPFEFDREPLIVQYEIKFQEGQECGGAYIKLLSHSDSLDLEDFQDKSPYTIMFGPDKCGETDKVHFIFRHKNPKTGVFEEKHAKQTACASYINDHKTHVYTLIVSPDNTYEILIDQEVKNSGSLLSDEDFKPPVNPPSEIDDPNDKKPEDWDERERIPDPDATKPDDWDEDAPAKIPDPDATKPSDWHDDEPEYIADPDAIKPSDWDEEEDGEWEAPQIANPKCQESGCGLWSPPMIKNPDYKGKWKAPMIDNPNYKGIWKPRKIPNPDFFEDKNPFQMTSIGAIGLELWSMSNNILFDNFLITTDRSVAFQVGDDGWRKKSVAEGGSGIASGVVDSLVDATLERPWLWGFYALALVLPFVLIAACCCRVKKDDSGDAKKTDEPQPDDPHKDESTELEQDTKNEDGDNEEVKEEDDEEREEDEEEKEEDEEDKEEVVVKKQDSKEGDKDDNRGDQDQDNENENSQLEESVEAENGQEDGDDKDDSTTPRRSPRKRTKARKDT